MAEPVNSVSASASGWSRRHRFTIRGYPDSVSEPGPKSVPTSTVSWSSQEIRDLASASSKPSATKDVVRMSNSRKMLASEPPRDSEIKASVWSGSMTSAPAHTQFSPSARASSSRSMRTSHWVVCLSR